MRPFFESLLKERSPYVRGEYPQPKPKDDSKADTTPLDMSDGPSVPLTEEFIPEPEVPAFVPDEAQGQ
jgi:hypothetical protein